MLAWQTGSIDVAYNRGAASVTVTIPPPPAGQMWFRAADTGAGMEPRQNFLPPGSEHMMHQSRYTLGARSLAILLSR